jgi:hypothetical protein
MKTGIELIADERKRQIEVEGWTPEHDDEHINGELAHAAACYAYPNRIKRLDHVGWPEDWSLDWYKPTPENRIKELVKAGALIAAEIDRIQNLDNKD